VAARDDSTFDIVINIQLYLILVYSISFGLAKTGQVQIATQKKDRNSHVPCA
jgi:hypothetical protein